MAPSEPEEATVTEVPREPAAPEDAVVQAMARLAAAAAPADKIDVVRGLRVTRAASRRYMLEHGFLAEWAPLLTVALVRNDDGATEALADVLAELLKDEGARTAAGESGVDEALAKLLARAHEGTKINALRCIGNFVFDNEPNRSRIVFAAKLLGPMLDLLAHPSADVVRAAANSAFNVVLTENEKIRDEALDAHLVVKCLERIRQSRELNVLKAVSNLLYSFFDSDRGIGEFLDNKGLEDVVALCRCDDTHVAETAITSLMLLAEIEKLRRALYEHGLVDFLFDLVDSSATLPMKRAAAKTIGIALADDKNMNSVFDDNKLPVFARWLANSDAEIRAYAALCITNVARTDAHCLQVIRSGLVEHLAEMTLSSELKEQNCSVNAFRNLCIFAEGKTALGDKGVVEKLVRVLEGDNSAAKYTATIVLKNLASQLLHNARRLVAAGGLAKMKAVFDSTSHDGMRCETARVVVSIVRLKDAALLADVLTGDGVVLLTELLKSEHAILRAEAYEAFALVLPAADDAHRAVALRAVVEHWPGRVKDDKEPAQLAAAELALALLADNAAVHALDDAQRAKAREALNALAATASAAVRNKLAVVATRLTPAQ